MEFHDYLKVLVAKDGSDLYLSTGAPSCIRIQGNIKAVDKEPNPPGRIAAIADSIMNEKQRADFAKRPEMNLAIADPNIGRFRVNIFRQRDEVSMVVRNIKLELPVWSKLGLPSVVTNLIMEKRGLILIVGGTGQGKSTTMAALIDHRNFNSAGHIITIEDPIEFIHPHRKSIVNQREIGVDTLCYEDALENTMRQAPDVIVIGEIRTRETMEHALAFAETGHLVVSTLHATNANQAFERIINFFPKDKREQMLLDISLHLKAIISQRLIRTLDEKLALATEVLIGNSTVGDYIRRGEIVGLKKVMEKSETLGMCTFDDSLFKLYSEGKIGADEAIHNADSQNNMTLKIKLGANAPVGSDASGELEASLPPEAAPPPVKEKAADNNGPGSVTLDLGDLLVDGDGG